MCHIKLVQQQLPYSAIIHNVDIVCHQCKASSLLSPEYLTAQDRKKVTSKKPNFFWVYDQFALWDVVNSTPATARRRALHPQLQKLRCPVSSATMS